MKSSRLGVIAFALFASAGFAYENALAQTTMRISIVTPKNSHYGEAIDKFASEVEKRTNGRYKIQTFYSSALGAEREIVEAVQMGTQELSLTGAAVTVNFVPAVKILDVPYLFHDYAHARNVLDGQIGQDLLKQYNAKGFQALAWGENGFRHMTNSKHAVNTPADLKGLKMRTMENPVHIQAYKAFGILPTPMAFSELFTALQQGTVDGQENPLSIITTSKFDQVQKYLTLTGHVYGAGVFLMSKAAYEKLSAADKQAFLEAAREGTKVDRARVDADEKSAVTELRGKGMQVVDNVDKSKFQAALTPVYADFEKQFGKANLDRIRNAR